MTPNASSPAATGLSDRRDAATQSLRAHLDVRPENGGCRILFHGALTVHSVSPLEARLKKALLEHGGRVVFDLGELRKLDTAGALLINKSLEALRRAGREAGVEKADDQQKRLLKKSVLPEPGKSGEQQRPVSGFALLNAFGKRVCTELATVGNLVGFLGQFLVTLFSLAFRPRAMRWTSLVFHMEQVGLRAVPIVSLLTFLIGLVVAYMGAQQLAMFGADIFAVNLLEVMVLREMAVLITAIVVAGRSSSSFTAQIGAMVANEEVDALRSMGLDPGALLVVPRVLALVITLPMLVFLADVMALLGGALAIWFQLDINFHAFLNQLHNVAKVQNFLVGIVKTPFFALSIGLVGCFQGFRATGSAESVGFLTTVAVVQSIFIVILLDALFAIFFTTIGV